MQTSHNSSITNCAPPKMSKNSYLVEKYRDFFSDYKELNKMQKKILIDVNLSTSLVISAPTGAGKTFLFDVMLMQLREENQSSNVNWKAVYLAPTKALCDERYADWTVRFERDQNLKSIRCQKVTGDSLNINGLAGLEHVDVIVTTPEQWNYLTHQWLQQQTLVGAIKLFMIDEAQFLDDDERGADLEVIVSRMKVIARSQNTDIRFVVASATIPNVCDMTTWLRSGGFMVEQHIFDETYRTVPLVKHVEAIKSYERESELNERILKYIQEYAHNKSTLVFCGTIMSTESSALDIVENVSNYITEKISDQSFLTSVAQSLENENLKKVLPYRVAFHHANLTVAERQLIEENFRNQRIRVLFATSTLAIGVNLPAHLVIIKRTQLYYGKEYPARTVIQMIGRAGRQKYDNKQGVAVILTDGSTQNLYNGESILASDIESHLFDKESHLLDILCVEVIMQSIYNRSSLSDWLRTTYLHVRTMRSANLCQLNSHDLEQQLLERCKELIFNLCDENLVLTVRDNKWQATQVGLLMVKHCLHISTMRNLLQLNDCSTLFDVFQVITRSEEFEFFKLKKVEKKLLNNIFDEKRMHLSRFPIAKMKQTADKVSCLLQASMGNLPIKHPTLKAQAEKMRRRALRICKCSFEILRYEITSEVQLSPSPIVFSSDKVKIISHSYKKLLGVVTMAKCLHANRWENSEYVMPLSNSDETGKTKLQSSLMPTDECNIESEINYELQMTLSNDSSPSDEIVKVLFKVVKLSNQILVDDASSVILVVGSEQDNTILVFHEISNKEFVADTRYEVGFYIVRAAINHIRAHLIHPELVGIYCNDATISTADLTTPEKKRKINDSVQHTPRKKHKFTDKLDPNQSVLTNYFSPHKRFENTAALDPSEKPSPEQLQQSEENLFMTQDFVNAAETSAPRDTGDQNEPNIFSNESKKIRLSNDDADTGIGMMETDISCQKEPQSKSSSSTEKNIKNGFSVDVSLDMPMIASENNHYLSPPLDLSKAKLDPSNINMILQENPHDGYERSSNNIQKYKEIPKNMTSESNHNESTWPKQSNDICNSNEFNICLHLIKSYLKMKNESFDFKTFQAVYGDYKKSTVTKNSVKDNLIVEEPSLPRLTYQPNKYRLILGPDPQITSKDLQLEQEDKYVSEEVVQINSSIMSSMIKEKNIKDIPSVDCEHLEIMSSNGSLDLMPFEEMLNTNNIL